MLLTGLHAVADIHCSNCKTTLGWKYVSIIIIIEYYYVAAGDCVSNDNCNH